MNIKTFENTELGNVRAFEKDGAIWFVAKDVCEILGILNTTQKVSSLDFDERAILNIGRQGEANVINESGLYSLILTSRKPEARKFKKWITSEVLPSIRKTGTYSVALSPAEMLLRQAQMLVDVERKQKYLEANQKALESRINTFDNLEFENDRQKLNTMIRKYAIQEGIPYREAWRAFKRNYNGAFHANITALRNNFKKVNGIKNLTMPAFLERTGRLQDALRVADRMLNA